MENEYSKPNILKEKSFALIIILLYKYLINQQKEYTLSKKILRSGTSIGALTKESENAASTKYFIDKLTIALKDADKTQYWLELLFHSDYITNEKYNSLNKDCKELIGILVAIVKR